MKELLHIAKKAGDIILKIYNSYDGAVEYKTDDSPLAKADIAAHNYIVSELQKHFSLPILSEEDVIPFEERKKWTEFFLVDPLDGTKEFIKKRGEFTVNIAFIQDGVPVYGVIYAPVIDVLYYNIDGKSYRVKNCITEQLPCEKVEGKIGVASHSHVDELTTAFLQKEQVTQTISMGSSLKFCLVAQGSAHVYPRLKPSCMQWDTGAADAILRGVGKSIKDLNGNELIYNRENLLNPGIITR